MIYIVDFEGFYLNNNFVIKELAIINLDLKKNIHLFFLPIKPLNQLNRSEKKIVKFYENNIHHPPWNTGSVSLNDFLYFTPELKVNDEIYLTSYEKRFCFVSIFNSECDFKYLKMSY